jgi:hypothetical protein
MLSVVMLIVIMLSVVMLIVIMLIVVMLRVVMLSVVMLSVVMLSVVMLSVVMLSVVALHKGNLLPKIKLGLKYQSGQNALAYHAKPRQTDVMKFNKPVHIILSEIKSE